MRPEEWMRDRLEALGKTDANVAASLRRHGVKGVRCAAQCCPITNYMRGEIEKRTGGGTGFAQTGLTTASAVIGGTPTAVALPDACAEFVRKLDCMEDYQDLHDDDLRTPTVLMMPEFQI